MEEKKQMYVSHGLMGRNMGYIDDELERKRQINAEYERLRVSDETEGQRIADAFAARLREKLDESGRTRSFCFQIDVKMEGFPGRRCSIHLYDPAPAPRVAKERQGFVLRSAGGGSVRWFILSDARGVSHTATGRNARRVRSGLTSKRSEMK